MKAIVQDRYGSPDEVLSLREIDTPVPGENDVLVRVRATSVHPDVWHAVTGWPWVLRLMGSGVRRPKRTVPGTDVAGVVESVGSKVTRFRTGDDVFGLSASFGWCNGGAFAEYAAVAEDLLALKPGNVTFEQAATTPTSGLIAMGNLRTAGTLGPGQHVLINGAGGGVGSIAVQVVKARGARVTGVDCAAKLDMIRGLGADHAIDYAREDFTLGSERYDFILDVASNLSIAACERVLTPRGLYWLIGHDHFGRASGRVFGSLPRMFGLLARMHFDKHLPRITLKMPTRADTTAVMDQLRDLLETGTLTPVVARTFPLKEVPAAMRQLQDGDTPGRIIITP